MSRLLVCLLIFLPCFAQAGVNTMQTPEKLMANLMPLAHKNLSAPFAAMIVETNTGKILCTGLNNSKANPTWHGEIVAINNCAKKYPHMAWSDTTLYTTAEPCPMCQSAIIWAGIPHVVFGTSIEVLKQLGWNQINIPAKDVADKAAFYKGTITGGVLADQTNPLLEKK